MTNSQFDLTGKVILITGGSGFLGQHFVDALAEAGAKVVITDRQEPESLQESVEFIEVDVTSQESVDELFSSVIKKHKKVDVVINNAAIDPKFDPKADQNEKIFENYPEELMKQSVDVNMLGYWRVAKSAVTEMLKQGSGNIINISSIYGMTVPHQDIYPEGTQKPVDYGMTKSAIQYLTRYIATTYGKEGIRSNALVLGGVFKGHDDEFVKKYSQHTMLGRMTKTDDVGAPLVFLASDASKGMTGHLMAVDAGWGAW